ncbi:DUF2357 domain-containing protein [Pseudogracilibacillus sp. SE30717A]|uniref:DUF2357 domain-containing protein n=1 Tax=Pseudogracilibacillus sp. SE30717A TaxID=3098293 RepID=UPI00300DD827
MIILGKIVFKFTTTLGNNKIYLSLISKGIAVGEKTEIERFNESKYEFYKEYKREKSSSPIPTLFVREEKSDYFRDICLKEQTEYDVIIAIPLAKEVIKERQQFFDNPIYPLANLKLKKYITFNTSDTWYEQNGYTYISASINFRNFIGVSKFYFEEEVSTDSFDIEVVSYKMSYEKDFQELLNQLSEIQTELLLSLDKPTEVALDLDNILYDNSYQVILLHLRRLMSEGNLPLALQTILSNPHSRLSYENEIEKVNYPGTFDLFSMATNPTDLKWKKDNLNERSRGFVPLEYFKEEVENTVDTKENQFIKFSLEEIEKLIIDLQKQLPSKFEHSKWFLESALDKVEGFLQDPFFRQVGTLTHLPNSMVLQRKSGYKDFLQAIQYFDSGIRLNSNISEFDVADGDLRPVSELYEYWCFFQIYYTLKEICGSEDINLSGLLSKTDRGYKLNLNKTAQSSIKFVYNALDIKLYYNRNFVQLNNELWEGSYDKGLFHPDISISITNKFQKHWLHFDSKYRLDNNKLEKMISGEPVEGNYLRNDIHTAHAYRDAILGTRGVYILYPDSVDNETVFVRQPNILYQQNYLVPSVGAFPLKPGLPDNRQLENITTFLKNVIDLFSNNILYQEETGFEKELGKENK